MPKYKRAKPEQTIPAKVEDIEITAVQANFARKEIVVKATGGHGMVIPVNDGSPNEHKKFIEDAEKIAEGILGVDVSTKI